MNARLIKETRDLLPIFVCMLPLIIVPQLLWPVAGFGYLALGLACLLMAGSTFGTEFQHRTLSLLLSQPIPRSVIWREKMLVLGAGIVTSLAALLICLAVSSPAMDGQNWLLLAFIPLCAFCGAPFWTLELRQSIGGMVVAVGAPCGMLAMYALVILRLGGNEPAALVPTILCLLLIYCALVYWLGYATFKRLEAVDAPVQELSLPPALEAILVAPLTKISSRFRGPFAALLKKEFRLQQVSFLLAGVFILIAVAGFCFIKRRPDIATGIIGGDICVYALILPLIAGAISVAEERGWEMAEWHLTLPPSALKQWSAKVSATLSISLALGLLLPAALMAGGQAFLGKVAIATALPPPVEILGWVLGQMLMTSVAIYTASFSRNTLRAILSAFAVIIAGVGVCAWVGYHAEKMIESYLLIERNMAQGAQLPSVNTQLRTLVPLLLSGALFFGTLPGPESCLVELPARRRGPGQNCRPASGLMHGAWDNHTGRSTSYWGRNLLRCYSSDVQIVTPAGAEDLGRARCERIWGPIYRAVSSGNGARRRKSILARANSRTSAIFPRAETTTRSSSLRAKTQHLRLLAEIFLGTKTATRPLSCDTPTIRSQPRWRITPSAR